MATDRAAFDRFIPNSPRKLSVPTADFSMTIMPFMNDRALSSSAPFDSRLPVVSRPRWRVYEVRSNSCSPPPNTISTCSTVLRSPSSRLSTRLRTSRDPSCASAQWSAAPSPITALRCWNAMVVTGSSWRLATSSRASRATDLERPGQERLRAVGGRLVRTDELLEQRRLGALAERDPGAGEGGPAGARPRPSGSRSAGQGGRRQARRTTPCVHSARVSWAKRSSAGSPAPPSNSSWTRSGRRAARSATVVSSTPAAAASSDSATPVTSPSVTSSRPSLSSGNAIGVGAVAGVRWSGRPGGARRAGRCTSCTAGSSRPAVPRTRRTRPGGRPPASRARPQAVSSATSARSTPSVKSVSPWRAGRGRGDATVIRATPPSRA